MCKMGLILIPTSQNCGGLNEIISVTSGLMGGKLCFADIFNPLLFEKKELFRWIEFGYFGLVWDLILATIQKFLTFENNNGIRHQKFTVSRASSYNLVKCLTQLCLSVLFLSHIFSYSFSWTDLITCPVPQTSEFQISDLYKISDIYGRKEREIVLNLIQWNTDNSSEKSLIKLVI